MAYGAFIDVCRVAPEFWQRGLHAGRFRGHELVLMSKAMR
jgi:hypothetical protein